MRTFCKAGFKETFRGSAPFLEAEPAAGHGRERPGGQARRRDKPFTGVGWFFGFLVFFFDASVHF